MFKTKVTMPVWTMFPQALRRRSIAFRALVTSNPALYGLEESFLSGNRSSEAQPFGIIIGNDRRSARSGDFQVKLQI